MTDLGTEFGVAVDTSGVTETQVSEGRSNCESPRQWHWARHDPPARTRGGDGIEGGKAEVAAVRYTSATASGVGSVAFLVPNEFRSRCSIRALI